MKYTVRVTANAERDADAAYRWLAKRTSHAEKWIDGLEAAIEGLSEFLTRCPLARENNEFDDEVRQLLYGKSPHVYRVLFIVRNNLVYVLHVRHGARQALDRSKIILPPE